MNRGEFERRIKIFLKYKKKSDLWPVKQWRVDNSDLTILGTVMTWIEEAKEEFPEFPSINAKTEEEHREQFIQQYWVFTQKVRAWFNKWFGESKGGKSIIIKVWKPDESNK